MSVLRCTVKNFTISRWISNMFLHETAKSRKVCGYAGNAHHSTFSCQRNKQKTFQDNMLWMVSPWEKKEKQADRRSHNTTAALKISSENYYALLWVWRERKKKEEVIIRRKLHTVFVNIFLCFPEAELKIFWESTAETENPNIWSGLLAWILNWSLMYDYDHQLFATT